jgi:hypothetical protein
MLHMAAEDVEDLEIKLEGRFILRKLKIIF